ncbi:MAG TPA: zinc ribbon domain-containing protein [Planctomycetaceae bacterium]|nr:zinc ribbon domain-containing protein [Planctomycetaceae bacterium]
MPTYDYKCEKCDHTWDLFQPITAKPVRKCPGCGAQKAKRVIGPGAGIIFKGSGFYQTDYRSDSYKKGAEADKKTDTAPDKTAESKSESASTATSEKKADTKPSQKS